MCRCWCHPSIMFLHGSLAADSIGNLPLSCTVLKPPLISLGLSSQRLISVTQQDFVWVPARAQWVGQCPGVPSHNTLRPPPSVSSPCPVYDGFPGVWPYILLCVCGCCIVTFGSLVTQGWCHISSFGRWANLCKLTKKYGKMATWTDLNLPLMLGFG